MEGNEVPKIGELKEVANEETGEVFYLGATDLPQLRKIRVVPNAGGGDNAPAYLVTLNGREVGAMFTRGPDGRDFVDAKGRAYFKVKLNGWPLDREIWLMAFAGDAPGVFNLDYSAPRRSAKAEGVA